MKTAKIILLILTLFVSPVFPKHSEKNKNKPKLNRIFEEADALFQHEYYSHAMTAYLEVFSSDPDNYNACYKLGLCYLKTHDEKAIYYLEKASHFASRNYKEGTYKERRAPIIIYKSLGEAYHQNDKFDLAIEAYMKFKKELITSGSKHEGFVTETNRAIELCQNAKKLAAKPVNAKIENMGNKVNTPYPEYAPVFSVDQSTMIFTSGRPSNIGGKTYNGGKYFEDIYLSTKTNSGWSEAINIGPPINTVGNDASVGISADGQEILIYKDDMGDGNIYSTSLNGTEWSTPVKLNSNINSKYWEPSAFISADGKTLYFTSDRPGGYGGRDIYMSTKNTNGQWGKAVNLGNSINTKYDEDAPFLHSDGKTLYFSSTGHNTMGGFDIFESTLINNEHWSKPVNVGYPINSSGDDVFYVLAPDKKTAYFTSMRAGGYGEKDNYMITYPDATETPLVLKKGMVLDSNDAAAKDVKITITDNKTGEVVGVYHPNTASGKYMFILTPGKSYNISYEKEGYLFYSENQYVSNETNYNEVIKSVKLAPVAVGSKVVLNNLFFDFDKSELRPYSNVELNRLTDFLNKYPNLSVEITGYTDSKGTDDYNKALSLARANAVVNFLIEKGIKKERMVAAGFGKSHPVAPNQNADGSDSPDGRQLNRRVELKITKIK